MPSPEPYSAATGPVLRAAGTRCLGTDGWPRGQRGNRLGMIRLPIAGHDILLYSKADTHGGPAAMGQASADRPSGRAVARVVTAAGRAEELRGSSGVIVTCSA